MSIILRNYQIDLKNRIYKSWDKGNQNVLAVMPTGSGKTKTFCTIAKESINGPEILPTAIIVHRKELLQQISLTLAEEKIIHNIIAPRKVILENIASHRHVLKRQFYDYHSPITVVSVDTLNARALKHKSWAMKIRQWITDEAAHLLLKNKWGRAVQLFPNARGLGVTATPQRLDKRGLGRHADGVFDDIVIGPTTRYLIQQGYLCRYKFAIPESDYRQFLKKPNSGSDYTKQSMNEADRKSHIIGDVVENYKIHAPGKQAIVFASSIETSHAMEKQFLKYGISAKVLTGNTPDKERLNTQIEYRDKKIQVLINVDLFDEGLDVPGIEAVIMARPTMSLSKYLQMIGRGLRPSPGKEFLIIIDHVGNLMEHKLPDMEREWTLDRIVKKKDRANTLRICSNYECNQPYDRAETHCPWCGTEAIKINRSGGNQNRPTLKQVDGDLTLLDPEQIEEMFNESNLEDPASLAERVAKAAGTPAGIKAMKNQKERIEVQKKLSHIIAKWAGLQKHNGLSDRSIYKKFYLSYGKSITRVLSEPKADMLKTIQLLEHEFNTSLKFLNRSI